MNFAPPGEVLLVELSTNGDPNQNMSDRVIASIQLNRMKERIMHVWESRVRENVSSAPSKPAPVLRSMLTELLENLVSNISPGSGPLSVYEAGKIGKEHGEQRAGLIDYSLSQVLFEYRILRQVVFEILEEEKLQSSEIRDIILDVLDEGIEKAVEQFFLVRSEELKRSNRDLEHFAAIAAHDLKSPLATITSFAELLDENLQGQLELEETEYIQAIKRSSARMTKLIDRLLEYSTVGREMKPFEPVSIHQIVRDVKENLKASIEKSNARLHFNDLPIVFGDASLLTQLFQNFLSNSLKFRDLKRAPEIYVEAKEEGRRWLFSIRDNGVGFDAKDKENIFSLFRRLDTVTAQAGSGIGLATARKVVELHGGEVWAESQPGQGSTFFFTLPQIGLFYRS